MLMLHQYKPLTFLNSGRGHRKKSTNKLVASLRAEQEDDDGNFIEVRPRRARAAASRATARTSVASKNTYDVLDIDDSEDEDFETDASGAESSDVEEVGSKDIPMEEVFIYSESWSGADCLTFR